MFSKKSIKDIPASDIKGKRILVRVDFNVPMKDGVIQDDTRIQAALPTLEYILAQQPKTLILMSHLGDPKKDTQKAKEKALQAGIAFDEEKYLNSKHRMAPIALHLGQLLKRSVKLAPAAIGAATQAIVDHLIEGDILMLENTRFHTEETSKDTAEREKMGKILAGYADLFVNDAFGTAHRAHASTEAVAHFLPAVSGLLMEKEIQYLGKVMENPDRPFVAIIGGAKVSSKIAVLENLLLKVDRLIVGGGMAYTFLKAKGLAIGDSLVEDDRLDKAREILQVAYEKHIYIYLPIDFSGQKNYHY